MKFFSQFVIFALGATVSAEGLQKRDVSLFVDSLTAATADFAAADNAIAGVYSQLNTTRQYIQAQTILIRNEGNLTKDDTFTVLNAFAPLMKTVETAMDHLAQRRDVVSKSPECIDVSAELRLTFVWGTFFFRAIADRADVTFKSLVSSFGERTAAKIKEQADALKCT